jgi:prophage endopeptidase
MNRTELVTVTAIVLLVAFAAGWFAYWLFHRFTRATEADMSELDRLSHELHEAEELRDQAIAYIHAREAELNSRLIQTEAELRAAMDGLREARRETEDLRSRLGATSRS